MDDDQRTLDRDRDFTDEASGRWDTDPITATSGIGAESLTGTDDTIDDPEVDALVVDIEATRAEMSQTVDQLGNRLDPSNVASRAGDAVREATIGKIETKVNDMTSGASDLASNAGQTAQQAGSGIVETIRRNPIPAAMTGIGLGMLWMNRQSGKTGSWSSSRTSSGRGYESSYGSSYGGSSYSGSGSDWMSGQTGYEGRSGNGNGSIGDTIGQRAGDATDTVRDAAYQARQTADEKLGQVGETANQAMSNVSTTASDAMAQAQRAVQSNPLAFGALAVAVGTAVGLAIPATNAEKRVMGQTGGQLIDKVENAVSEPLDQMQQS